MGGCRIRRPHSRIRHPGRRVGPAAASTLRAEAPSELEARCPRGSPRWENGSMTEHIEDHVERMRMRRAPKFSVFLLVGAALGVILAMILTFAFSGTDDVSP